ncbi:hypothetical protein CRYUN_Cryun05aG0205800 [Craigia yunnanensis]
MATATYPPHRLSTGSTKISHRTLIRHRNLRRQSKAPTFTLAATTALMMCFQAWKIKGYGNSIPKDLILARATLIHILELQRQRCKQALEDIKSNLSFAIIMKIVDTKKLDQTYCDPSQRLVADCVLTDVDTAVVSDCKGSIAVLSCSDHLEDNASPERNLTLTCAYYMGEIAMSIRKGSFIYKLPADDMLNSAECLNASVDPSHSAIMASTLLGSIMIFIPISREEHELLEAVQARLIVHPSTAPVLGNDHNEYHSCENPVGVPKILDGDMLAQFLELTSMQQVAVLSFPIVSPDTHKLSSKPPPSHIPVNKVVQLLERIHYALN